MREYIIHENIRDNVRLRNGYLEFIQTIFPGLDFKDWYDKGFWNDRYNPFCLTVDGRIISNASASEMNVLIEGEKKRAVQIGAVGTLGKYRKQGYARIIMDYVLERYECSTDMFFLFANESVIDYYPRFGFKRANDVIFKSTSDIPEPDYRARKLDLSNSRDFDLLKKMITNRMILTERFGASGYEYVTFWHLLNLFPHCLHYLQDHNLIAVASQSADQLNVWDLIFTEPIEIDSILPGIMSEKPDAINFYFSPDIVKFNYDSVFSDDDAVLFVRGDINLPGADFKFPLTAQT